MPHTNRKPAPAPFKPAKFLNITLTPEDKERIKATNPYTADFDDSLQRLLGQGYKLSIKFDERNDAFVSWIIAPDGGENKGYILPGRGSTALKAIRQALYIHHVILQGLWAGHEVQDAREIDD